MEAEDEVLLVVGDVAALHGRPEVVHPPETAALAAPEKARPGRKSAPAAFPFLPDEASKDVVLRVIAAGLDATRCSVVRVMTPHPDTAPPTTTIHDSLKKMHGACACSHLYRIG